MFLNSLLTKYRHHYYAGSLVIFKGGLLIALFSAVASLVQRKLWQPYFPPCHPER